MRHQRSRTNRALTRACIGPVKNPASADKTACKLSLQTQGPAQKLDSAAIRHGVHLFISAYDRLWLDPAWRDGVNTAAGRVKKSCPLQIDVRPSDTDGEAGLRPTWHLFCDVVRVEMKLRCHPIYVVDATRIRLVCYTTGAFEGRGASGPESSTASQSVGRNNRPESPAAVRGHKL
jgi:hypothetical protein